MARSWTGRIFGYGGRIGWARQGAEAALHLLKRRCDRDIAQSFSSGCSRRHLVREVRPGSKGGNLRNAIRMGCRLFAEPTYFVPDGTIEGANSLSRASAFIKNGKFSDARFEMRDDSVYRLVQPNKWFFDDPGVKDTKELAGLKLTTMLLSNWDIKRDNTAVVDAGGHRYYALTDWGASMGVAQDRSGRSKWDCEGFAKQSQNFVQEVGDGFRDAQLFR